jgi:hypothetical protein
MTEPLFKIGDRVSFWAGASTDMAEPFSETNNSTRPAGVFEVLECLPAQAGQRRYRVRGGLPPHERLVLGAQITRADKSG